MFRRRRRRADPLVVDVDGDGDRSLAQGTVVDTAIVARVARIPLLRLEGTVVLTPGHAVAATPGADAAAPTVVGAVEPAHRPGLHELPAPPVAAADGHGDGAIGADLPDVARRLKRLRRR